MNSIPILGGRFEYGFDCADLAYTDNFEDGSNSDAEYDEYADYVIKYSDKEIQEIVAEYLLNGSLKETLVNLIHIKTCF